MRTPIMFIVWISVLYGNSQGIHNKLISKFGRKFRFLTKISIFGETFLGNLF